MEKINNRNQKIKRGKSENPNEEFSSKTNNQNEILTSISNLKIENKKLKEELLKHKNYSKYLSSKKMYLNKTIIQLKKQLHHLEKSNNMDNEDLDDNYCDGKESAIRAVEQQIINELCNNKEIDFVERLPGISFKTNYFNESECGICRDEFKEGEIIKVLNCNHLFHRECLSQWLINNKKCIICDQLIKV